MLCISNLFFCIAYSIQLHGYTNLLQYSCLENSMDRGAWRATVHGVTHFGGCGFGWFSTPSLSFLSNACLLFPCDHSVQLRKPEATEIGL